MKKINKIKFKKLHKIKMRIPTINKLELGVDTLLFSLYLAITPINQILKYGGGSLSKYICLLIMIFLLVGEYVINKSIHFRNNLIKAVLLVMGWFCLTVFWTYDFAETLTNLVTAANYFIFFILICSHHWTDTQKKIFVHVFIVACLIYSFILFGAMTVMTRASIRTEEFKADQNYLAMNVSMGALFATYYMIISKDRQSFFVYLCITAILLAGILSTGSRGGLGVFLISAIFLAAHLLDNKLYRKRIGIITVVFLICFVGMLFSGLVNERVTQRYIGKEFNLNERGEIAVKYIDIMASKPYSFFVGFGYGSERKAYGDYYNTSFLRATHNDTIRLIAGSGIIGFFLFVGLLYVVWDKAYIKRRDFLGAACFILVVLGTFDINIIERYIFWNGLIFAYIGIGANTLPIKRKKTTLSLEDGLEK
ncbi:MAG: O-antigen ligase family protein [Abditibacteriota bacterium]|nr:O-antigen ligase family protein [Abditibacteriota bacterium]